MTLAIICQSYYMDFHFLQVEIENNLTKRTFSDSAKEAFMNSLLNTDWTFVEDKICTQILILFLRRL